MAKFEIPRFRYLFQDKDGDVWVSSSKPDAEIGCWVDGKIYNFKSRGKKNHNWRDTLIDLDKDDYEFEDGILRRIGK